MKDKNGQDLIPIGTKVKFNDDVAVAFVGLSGVVIEHKELVNSQEYVNVVELDDKEAPNRYSMGYSKNFQSLGVPSKSLYKITGNEN